MKNLSLYFCAILVFALAVTGCKKIEPKEQYLGPCQYFYIVNDTSAEIVVDVKDTRTDKLLTSTTIPVGKKRGIYRFDPKDLDMDPRIETRAVISEFHFYGYDRDMIIDGKLIHNNIWKPGYWAYEQTTIPIKGHDVIIDTYTLTVNDEFWAQFGPTPIFVQP